MSSGRIAREGDEEPQECEGSVRLALQAGLSSVLSTCEAMDAMQQHECVHVVVADVTQSCTRGHEVQKV